MCSSAGKINPFKIKSELLRIVNDCSKNSVDNFTGYDFSVLDKLDNKTLLNKLLIKELENINPENEKILKFLSEKYLEKDMLVENLWATLKSPSTSSETKIIVLNFLRELETDWKYEDYDAYAEDFDIIDEDTKMLLDKAIVNPEVQIDFLDFLNAVDNKDKILLIKSLESDYSEDALANILIPVFLSQPESDIGKEALNILGGSRSQLAYHALNTAFEFASDELKPLIKKNMATLKLSGIREDNSEKFYKSLLSSSKIYRCCTTYPDGHGNQALVFSRTNEDNRVQFVAIVINDYNGIRDCFGFNDISEFECDKIIERFYKDDASVKVEPKVIKSLLLQAENISFNKGKNKILPYEYVCWKNLLADVEWEKEDFKSILSQKYVVGDVDLAQVSDIDFMSHWFLDSDYSSEFEEFLAQLNDKIKTNLENIDFDSEINGYFDKIFYQEEKNIWKNRLLTCSYLKMKDKKDNNAQLLYSLYFDEQGLDELLKNILRKSIYEYYFSLKYNNDENKGEFSLDDLDKITAKIEKVWVQDV